MRATTRIATVLAMAAAVAVVCGGWGSATSSPAYAPTQSAVASAGRTGPVAEAESHVVLLASPVLPQGLALPSGVGPASTTRTFTRGELRGWEASVDLGPVAVAAALRSLRDALTDQGFEIRGGSHDLFGARQRDGRWEIVVARVEHHGRADTARDVLTVGIGTRPA